MNNNMIKLGWLCAMFSFFVVASCSDLSKKEMMYGQERQNSTFSEVNTKNSEVVGSYSHRSKSDDDDYNYDRSISSSKKTRFKGNRNNSNKKYNLGNLNNQLRLIERLCNSVGDIRRKELTSTLKEEGFAELGRLSYLLFTNPGNNFNKAFEKYYDSLIRKTNSDSEIDINNRKKERVFENSNYKPEKFKSPRYDNSKFNNARYDNSKFNNSNYIKDDNSYSNYEFTCHSTTSSMHSNHKSRRKSGPPNVMIDDDDTSEDVIETNLGNNFGKSGTNSAYQNFSNTNNSYKETDQIPDWANLDFCMNNNDIFNDDDLDSLMNEYVNLEKENLKYSRNKGHSGSHGKGMSMKECFNILNLSSSASVKQIKKRYKKLARMHHPDRNLNGDSSKFLRISEAYLTLKDLKDFS